VRETKLRASNVLKLKGWKMLLDQHQQQQHEVEEVETTMGNENYGFIYLFYKTTSRFRHFSYRKERRGMQGGGKLWWFQTNRKIK
jgi:hypothetical protein